MTPDGRPVLKTRQLGRPAVPRQPAGTGSATEPGETGGEPTQRDLIAEAACAIIAEGGLRDLTFRRVATAVGSTTGLISHWFPTRDALLRYTLDYAAARLDGLGSVGTWSDIDNMLDLLFDVTVRHEELERRTLFTRVWLAYIYAASIDRNLADDFRHWDDRYRREILRLVRARRDTTAPRDDPELVADAINALLDGLAIHGIVDPDRFGPERMRTILSRCIAALEGSGSAEKAVPKMAKDRATSDDDTRGEGS